jgi:hypothetical protein
MGKTSAAPQSTPPSLRGESSPQTKSRKAQSQFVSLGLTMGWQLAVVVLVPVIIGVQLDKTMGTSFVWTFVGLGVALVGSGFVMWRTMQKANSFPVPKLSKDEKRAVQKSYEEDDADV